jgi:Immunity protein 53
MNILRELQEWYESQCDDDWEHQFGVSIGTLDNPGWTVTIDLTGTDLAGATFETIEDLPPDRDWIKCWVADAKFNGVGGPQKLEEILTTFLQWAQTNSHSVTKFDN